MYRIDDIKGNPSLPDNWGLFPIGESTLDGALDSDIDIAIELRPEKKSLSNFFGIRRYLEQQFGKTVDLGIESTLKPLAREMVAKEIIHV